MLQHFGAYLEAKGETIFVLQARQARLNRTSVRRRRPFATMKTQVDLDFSFILMISAIYSTPMSSLTFAIWTTTDTTTTSTWLPPSQKICPERSPWSPSFLKRRRIRSLLVTSAATRSLPFPKSCLPWIRCITTKNRRRKTMPWSSYTRTSLRYSRCCSILPCRLSRNLMTLSLLTPCFPSARALLPIYVRCYSNFLAKLLCTLVESSSRRSQVCWSLIQPALASLPGLNQRQLWLLPSGTM